MLLIFGNVQNDMVPTGTAGQVTPAVAAPVTHINNPMVVHVGRMMVRLIPFLIFLGI